MSLLDLRLSNASDAELHALSVYKSAADNTAGQSQCFVLNRQLEHGLFPDEMGDLGSITQTLDTIFSRCPKLTEPLTVYRAISLRLHYPLSEPGMRFRNLSFWSTSARRDKAISFFKADGTGAFGALLTLKLPVGLAIYNMETLTGAGGHEQEFLLPRGILWEVGPSAPFDMKLLLPSVAKRFTNILEVTLTASSSWRTR